MIGLFLALWFSAQQTTTEAVDVTALASSVLDHTIKARTAIAAGDAAAARRDVDEGLRQATRARAALEAFGKPLVVPLSEEVETTSTIGPMKRGKPIDRKASVREVEVEHRSVTLDVGMAQDKLTAARAALDRGDTAAADAQLAALAQGAEEQTVLQDPALLKARQNLLLARTRVEQGRYKDAEAPLRTAANALGEDSPMGRDIANYAKRIRRDNTGALDRIDAWLRELGRVPVK